MPLPAFDALGADHPPYAPIFERTTPWIDADHQAIADLPVDGAIIVGAVPGFLRPADALLLYELAYYAADDVLELGSAWGLSTSILGRAIHNSGRANHVASIEWDPAFQAATGRAMQQAGLGAAYEGLAGPAHEWLPELLRRKRRFDLVFVDHDHSLDATRQVCAALPQLLTSKGIAVFHDFNDERNRTEPAVYGIYRAVSELINGADFVFSVVMGCCALVQRRAP